LTERRATRIFGPANTFFEGIPVQVRTLLLGAAVLMASAAPARAQRPDSHFLDPQNEYFVANHAYESGWQWVVLARMLRPASDTTHGEAQFITTGPGAGHQPGERIWSAYFWRTRIAAPADVTIGKVVFCVDLTNDAGAYRPPANRAEAVETQWWIGTITDVEDLYKQEAKVGEYRVNINCLRVEQAGK
jgi:hypothetical protein